MKLLPSKAAGSAVHAARERRLRTAKPAATYGLLAAAWLWAAALPATAQVTILHIRVVEGQDVAHVPGSRSTRPLTAQVTAETSQPVEGAAVTFHLPDEGPGGTFSNGLRTDVATTDARGRASSRGLQANRTAGRFQVRIVASKEQARAGTVCWQSVGDDGADHAIRPDSSGDGGYAGRHGGQAMRRLWGRRVLRVALLAVAALPAWGQFQLYLVNGALEQPVAGNSGTVTLTFQPAVAGAADPGIVWASGGQTAAFTFSAGDTQGHFGAQTAALFQTGTTAGTLTILAQLGGLTDQQTAGHRALGGGDRHRAGFALGGGRGSAPHRIRQHPHGGDGDVHVLRRGGEFDCAGGYPNGRYGGIRRLFSGLRRRDVRTERGVPGIRRRVADTGV